MFMGENRTAEFSDSLGTRTLRVEIDDQTVHMTVLEGNSKQYAGSVDVSDIERVLYKADGYAASVFSKVHSYHLRLDGDRVTLNVQPQELQVAADEFKKLFPDPADSEDEPA